MPSLRWTYAEYQAAGSIPGGQTLVIADSATMLEALSPADIAALAAAGVTALDATDDTLTLSLAQAQALGSVALTASDVVLLSDDLDAISALAPAGLAALAASGMDAIDLTGGMLSMDPDQVAALGGMQLSLGYADWLSGAVLGDVAPGYQLRVLLVPAGAAATVAGDATVAALLVTDGSAAIATAFASLGADAKLVSLTLTDPGALALDYASYAANPALAGKFTGGHAPSFSLSAVPPASAAAMQADARVVDFGVSGTATEVAGAFGTLAGTAKLTAIALTDGAPLALTATQYAAGTATLALLPNEYTVSLSGVTAAGAAAAEADDHVAGFVVSDTAANVAASLASLTTNAKLGAIMLSDGSTLNLGYADWLAGAGALGKLAGGIAVGVTGVTVADAATVQASALATSFSVSDTTLNVVNALASLAADSKLGTIALTDDLPISLSYAQYGAAGGVLALLPGGRSISVAAVPATAAAGVQADALISGFTVIDSSANVAAALDTLSASGKLTAILLDDLTPLAITATQYAAGAAARALLPGDATLLVSAASLAQSATLQADAQVAGFTLADSAAQVASGWTGLQAATKLTAISLSGGGPLTLTAAQYASLGGLLALLPSGYTLVVTGAAAATAVAAQSDEHVTGFSITDSGAAIAATLDTLAGLAKLTAIGAGGDTVTIGFDQLSSAAPALALLNGDAKLVVADVAVSQAQAAQANAWVDHFTLADTAASIVAALTTLAGAGKLSAITVIDNQPLVLSRSQYLAAGAAIALLPGSATVTIVDALVTDVAVLRADAVIDGFEVSDTAAHIAAAIDTLAGEARLTGIQLQDSYLLPVSFAQLTSAATAIALLRDGARVSVSGAPASAIAGAETTTAIAALTVSDTAANIASAFAALDASTKVASVSLTDAAALVLSYDQIIGGSHGRNLITGSPLLAVRADAVVLGFSAIQLASLVDQGVQKLVALSGSLSLDVGQYLALGPITLTGTDTVVLADTGANYAQLSAAQVAALVAFGIDRLDATDNVLPLTVELFQALGGVALTGNDVVTLADAGSNIAALTPLQISRLAGQGIAAIDATDDTLTLTLGQFNARGSVAFTAADTIIIADLADYLADINFAAMAHVDGIIAYDSPGAQRLYGTLGNDIYYVDTRNDMIYEGPGGGIDTIITSTGYYLWPYVENLVLAIGAGAIYGVGNAQDNSLNGNEAANLLIGLGGHDTINGDDGNDILYGGDGDDSLNGGAGVDYLAGGDGNDTQDGGLGADALYGEAGDDSLVGGPDFVFDQIVGGVGNDTLDGASGHGDYDYLYGGTGDDAFHVDTPADLVFEFAGEGNDTVHASITGAGSYLYDNIEDLVLLGTTPFGVGNALGNRITGNAGANWLLGDAGDDTLNGKAGSDVLFGEAGADVFVFERGTDGDVIGDFTPGEDRIQLVGLGFANFSQVQANLAVVGGSSAINLGQGDFIVINGVSSFTAGDFIFS